MGLIDRYILRRVAALTLPTLAVISGVVITSQLLLNVEMLTRSAAAALNFAKLAVFFVPPVTMMILPFAVLIGAVRTLSAMNADSELAVLESAGRAPRSTVRPVALLALLASLAAAISAHTIEPLASRAMQDGFASASADIIRSAARSGSFTQIASGTYVQIGREYPNGEMANVLFVDNTGAETQVIYYAKRGTIVTHDGVALFALADGELHRMNKLDGNVSIISFASSAINLGVSGPASTSYAVQSRSTLDLLDRVARLDAQGRKAPDETRELHRRATEWLYPLLFGLIAAYISGTAVSHRRSARTPVVMGTLVALVLRTAGFITISNAGASATAAAASYAIPVLGIAVMLVLNATGWRVPLPRRLAASVAQSSAALLRKVVPARARASGAA